jgi:eukaryotic-like serine/threonine-protein kinase
VRSGALFEADAPQPLARRFGPYRLERQIGAGGMGTVYYAERADDLFEKGVAVKVLPPGMGTDSLLQRFEAERRILARLEHPGIAGLLDGGVAEDGTPFFVLEYVDGLPIDGYCRDWGLSVEERLRLFIQVCETVDHAHRNLVVHRDLKPSNIMVTEDGRAKLLDFGIAKVLDVEEGEEDPQLTRIHGRPLTPGFASPEQVRGEMLTTSADVYSLGVLLYLLLAGRPPYSLASLTPAQAEHIICDEVPPLPSQAATVEGSGMPLGTDERLRRRLRGDLDVIVMTALQKDPTRRYASVRAMAEDIERHLTGHPVRARPDTVGYRLSRFVRRHRTLVGAYLAVSALLAGFTGLAAYTAVTSRAQNLAISLERDRAQLESQKASTVSEFLISLFGANDPDRSGGEALSALDLMERGERTAGALVHQPAVQARMLDVIGQVYTRLGRYDRAEPLFRQALDLQRALLAEAGAVGGGPARSWTGLEPESGIRRDGAADLAGVLVRLGDLLEKAGRREEARTYLEEAVALAEAADAPLVLADGLNDLGLVQYGIGEYAAAEDSHRAALALRREHLGDRHERTGASLQNLALVLSAVDRGEEAEAAYREALEIYGEYFQEENTAVAIALNGLGRLLMERGEYGEAEPLLAEALRIQRIRLGPRHPNVALVLNDVAAARARQGDFAGAEESFREALSIREEVLGPDHPYVAISLNNLSFTLFRQGKLEESLPLRVRAYELALDRLGNAHDNTGVFAHNLGEVLERLGRVQEAEEHYRESLAILERAFPGGHSLTTRPLVALGRLLLNHGRAGEAEPLLREALAIRQRLGAGPSELATVEEALAEAERALGSGVEGRPGR